jgi:actin-like ATPase involved in cell morphogenesis
MAKGPQPKKGGQQGAAKGGVKSPKNAAKSIVHGAAVGIDFGTATVTLAAYKAGQFEAIVNTDGERYTPLVAGYTLSEVFLGSPAKSIQIKSIANTVTNILNFIAKPFKSLTDEEKAAVHCGLIELENGLVGFEVEYKDAKTIFTPDQIITEFSQQLLKYAQQYWDCPMNAAVLSVPHNFTQEQQTALASAVEKAGFFVLGTVSDPIAAALSFHLDQPLFNKINTYDNSPFAVSRVQADNILVVDVGQNSIKTSLVSVQQGLLKHVGTLAVQGGASAIDKALLTYFSDHFEKEYGESLYNSSRAVVRLKQSVEQVKRAISVAPTASVQLDGLYMGLDLFSDISKMKFDALTTDFFNAFGQQLEDLFAQYPSVKPENISRVVLAGGSAALARFGANITKFFNSKHVSTMPEILKHVNICDTVAFGAAKLATTYAQELHPETQTSPGDERHKEQMGGLTTPVPTSPKDGIVLQSPGNSCVFTPYTHHTHLALSKSVYVKTFHNTYVTALQSTTAAPSQHYVPFTVQHPKKTFGTLQSGQGFIVELVESDALVPEHVTASNSKTIAKISLPREQIIAASGADDLTVTVVLQFALSIDFKLTTSVAYHVKGQNVPAWNVLFTSNLLTQEPLPESKYSTVLPAPTLQQEQVDLTERLIARVQYIVSRYQQWVALPKHQKYLSKNMSYMGPFLQAVNSHIKQDFEVIVNQLPNPYTGLNLDKKFSIPTTGILSAKQLDASLHTFSTKLHDLLDFRKFSPQEAAQELRRRSRVSHVVAAVSDDDDDDDDDLDLGLDDLDLDMDDDLAMDDDDDVGGDDLDLDLDLDIDMD